MMPGVEILRGYWARIYAIDFFTKQFLSKYGEISQIVSLGAGFDTLYFRLQDQGYKIAKFIELDLPSVVRKKKGMILRSKVNPSDNYELHEVDLANLARVQDILSRSVDRMQPLMVISECVFMYLEQNAVKNLLSYMSSLSEKSHIMIYDGIHDSFTNTMKDNLQHSQSIKLNLQTNESYLESLRLSGFHSNIFFKSMLEMYNHPEFTTERERISKLMMLDDTEIWDQIMSHYCFVISQND